MNLKWLTMTGLALAAVLLLAVNIFSEAALSSARVDFTQNKLYTLSDGTRKLVASLQEPIRLRLYLSQGLVTQLPRINAYAKRVRELLEEYQRDSHGKLAVSVIDPEPFTAEEDRAVGYGLKGIPLDQDSTFYFGLVATGSTNQEEVIPYLSLDREEFLEYDITRLIYRVAHPQQKVIGLISFLPLDGLTAQARMTGAAGQPWMVLDQMRQLFEVRTLDPNISEIPKDVNVLMLVHPKNLSDQTQYAIDQFVLRGGHALIFVDPHAEADQTPPANMMTATTASTGSSDLNRLFEAWGVKLTPAKVVGDLQLATRVQFQRGGRLEVMDYPVWIMLPPAELNQKDIVTASLGSIRMGTPGSLEKLKDATTQITPLMESTTNAMEIGTDRLGYFSDPQDTVRDYKPDGKRYILAARITGPVRSAFPDGPPPANTSKTNGAKKPVQTADKSKDAAKPEHLTKSAQDINVIVVADTDILQDQFWVQVQDFLGNRIAIPNAGNGAFVINALDNLTGSNELIAIRSRGRFTRPFTRVAALRQQAEVQFRQKEQELTHELDQTESKLKELEAGKQGNNAAVLTEDQQKELTRFRQDKIRIRDELRNVRHELRKNIESLEGSMRFINIALMPILIGFGGVVVGSHQMRRRKRAARKAADIRE